MHTNHNKLSWAKLINQPIIILHVILVLLTHPWMMHDSQNCSDLLSPFLGNLLTARVKQLDWDLSLQWGVESNCLYSYKSITDFGHWNMLGKTLPRRCLVGLFNFYRPRSWESVSALSFVKCRKGQRGIIISPRCLSVCRIIAQMRSVGF